MNHVKEPDLETVRRKTIFYTSMFCSGMYLILVWLTYNQAGWFVMIGHLIGFLTNVVVCISCRAKIASIWLINLTGLYTCLFLVIVILSGYQNGAGLMWVCAAPPLAYMCLGVKPGVLVSICFAIMSAIALFVLDIMPEEVMPLNFRIRYFFAYLLVTTVTASYAVSVDRYRQKLESAKKHILSLERMLPMCMHCKKVKQDDNWNSIESYVAEEASVQVSHGICPACAKEHYADYVKKDDS